MRLRLMQALLPILLMTGVVQSNVRAGEYSFLRINTPKEHERYRVGANCALGGVLQLADGQMDGDVLHLRVRLYRPGDKIFVIANEAAGKLTKAETGNNRYYFSADIKIPQMDGTYLLRVDCLNLRESPKSPKQLVASASFFLEVVPR